MILSWYYIALQIWIIAFFVALFFDDEPEIKKEDYFPMLIDSFRRSRLRLIWKSLYLFIMYSIGIIILTLYKSVELPSNLIKRLGRFLFLRKVNEV